MKIHHTPAFYLGIDVGKRELHCHIIAGNTHHKHCFPNTKKDRKTLIKWLKEHVLLEDTVVCIEHTGHYGRALCFELADTKISALFVVNPRLIKAFGQQRLRRSKTDSADAKLIAEFIKKEHDELHVWEPPSKTQQSIAPLSRHSENLTRQRAKLKTQLQTTDCKLLQQSIIRMIKHHDKEIASIEQKIDKLIASDEQLATQKKLIISTPSLGEGTARTLLSEISDINAFDDARQFAAWVGVTPKHFQSGTSGSTRTPISKIGNTRIRRALYLPAMNAMTYNPIIKKFADRLRKNGKTGQQIIIAVMRKLLHILYGILTSGQDFNPNHLNPNTPRTQTTTT